MEKISNDPKGNSGKKKATTEKGNLEKIDKKLAKQEIDIKLRKEVIEKESKQLAKRETDIKLRREAIERGIKQLTRKEQEVNFKKSIVDGEFKKLTRKEQDVNFRRGIVERKAKLLAKRENEIKQKERIIEKSRKHLNKLKDNYGKAQLLGIGDSKPRSVNSKLKTLDSLHKKSQKIDNRSSLKTLNMSENWNTTSFGLAELFGDADKFGYTTKPMQGKVSLGKNNICKPVRDWQSDQNIRYGEKISSVTPVKNLSNEFKKY
ncbi:MAG: hypothetical protein AB8V06_03450 [Francisella endosymbiont of Hyalomma asiaticum]